MISIPYDPQMGTDTEQGLALGALCRLAPVDGPQDMTSLYQLGGGHVLPSFPFQFGVLPAGYAGPALLSSRSRPSTFIRIRGAVCGSRHVNSSLSFERLENVLQDHVEALHFHVRSSKAGWFRQDQHGRKGQQEHGQPIQELGRTIQGGENND